MRLFEAAGTDRILRIHRTTGGQWSWSVTTYGEFVDEEFGMNAVPSNWREFRILMSVAGARDMRQSTINTIDHEDVKYGEFRKHQSTRGTEMFTVTNGMTSVTEISESAQVLSVGSHAGIVKGYPRMTMWYTDRADAFADYANGRGLKDTGMSWGQAEEYAAESWENFAELMTLKRYAQEGQSSVSLGGGRVLIDMEAVRRTAG